MDFCNFYAKIKEKFLKDFNPGKTKYILKGIQIEKKPIDFIFFYKNKCWKTMQLHTHRSGGEAYVPRIFEVEGGAEGKRESQADAMFSAVSNVGLSPRTPKS